MHAKQLLISSIAIILIKCYRVLPLVWTVRKVCSPRMHGGAAVQKKDWFSHWEEDCLSGGPDRAETEQGCLCLQGPAHTELPAAGHRRLLRCSDKPGAECTHITFTSVTLTWSKVRSQIHISHAQLCLYHGCSHATCMSNITHCSSPSLNKHVDFVGKTSFHLHLCALSQSERDQSSKLWSLLNYCTMLTCPWIRAKHPIWNIKH